MDKEINQFGPKAVYIEQLNGDFYNSAPNSSLTMEEIINGFNKKTMNAISYFLGFIYS